MFPVYVIESYEVLWDMGTAVVAAPNSGRAVEVLEESLRRYENSMHKSGEDPHFNLRGKVRETDYSADKEGVVYDSCQK